jgi:hypothetical protein
MFTAIIPLERGSAYCHLRQGGFSFGGFGKQSSGICPTVMPAEVQTFSFAPLVLPAACRETYLIGNRKLTWQKSSRASKHPAFRRPEASAGSPQDPVRARNPRTRLA